MNLHGVAGPVIAAVNPQIHVTVQFSLGSTLTPDGTRVPAFSDPVALPAQLQPLSTGDLRMLDGINLQGTDKAIYLYGLIEGVARPSAQGGDLVTLPDGSVWLTTLVLEAWPDWVKAVITEQNRS